MSTEKFRTREQILAAKYWSGEDTGRAYLYSLLAPLEGKPQIPDERLLEGVNGLIGNEERRIYEDYRALYQFLTFENGAMQAYEYAVKAEIAELRSYLLNASVTETYFTGLFEESIKVTTEEFSKIADRTARNITGESGFAHRYFDIDDITDMIVYYSTMQEGFLFSPATYNNARALLGSDLPEIQSEPSPENLPLYNSELKLIDDILDYADIAGNPMIDALVFMPKAQQAALRDSLCMRLSNTKNYDRYKNKPTMNGKFKQFREYMRQWFKDIKISGHTLYYSGFTCFFLLARHTDTIFYDCVRKKNGVAIISKGAETAENRSNVQYTESPPSSPAFLDDSHNVVTEELRHDGGLLSLCKKRTQAYQELTTRPQAHRETYLFLYAYNKFIELIADRVRMPALKLLQNDLTHLEEAAAEYEDYIDYILARVTGDIEPAINKPYALNSSERKKLKAFFEGLPRLNLEPPTYKEEGIDRVKHLIKELGIFSVYPTKLIKIIQNGGENNEPTITSN